MQGKHLYLVLIVLPDNSKGGCNKKPWKQLWSSKKSGAIGRFIELRLRKGRIE